MRLPSPWKGRLADTAGPLHERLVTALAEDIASGVIPIGARLPPHRDLAFRLGLGLGTVTKAYGILERRGLVQSVRGRGMFVADTAYRPSAVIDLSINTPPQMLGERLFSATLSTLAKRLTADSFGRYQPIAGRHEHRVLVARWLAGHRLNASPERLFLCHGAQHALLTAFALACRPNGVLLIEATTYPGAIAIARHAGYQMKPLDIDDEGVTIEALERSLNSLAKSDTPAALYITPTLQNPTTATMGLHRRQAIVDLCRRYDAVIVEDDVYSLFTPAGLPALAALAPERTLYVNGFSKILSPGLRVGILVTPCAMVDRALASLSVTSSMASPLACAMIEQWLMDGTAASVGASLQLEAIKRTALARSSFSCRIWPADTAGFHIWLPMPMTDAESLRERAAAVGVVVTPPSALLVDPNAKEAGIRLCIGSPSIGELESALMRINGLLTKRAVEDSGLMMIV